MIADRIDEILMLYNLIDDICIIDKDGFIVYSESFRRGAYSFNMSQIVGKHIFEVYPSSNEKTSNMYKVLTEHTAILNYRASWTSFKGDSCDGIVDTLPVFENGEFAGVVEIAKFVDEEANSERAIRLLDEELNYSRKRLYSAKDIVTSSSAMLELKEKIRKVSRTKSPVMIYGETGTGKEIVAEAIHSQGERSKMPFISQNCSSIPPQLLESILFGTEKGGFTGAVQKKGLFEIANHGTLFLDEINSMDFNSQSKILKAIEEQKIMRVGGEKYIDVDVRIICALNENPFDSVKNGRLREDLLYRLSAVILSVPPLRERDDDLSLLIDRYLKKYSEQFGNPISGISDEAMDILKKYTWPGNVRELKNVIEGAFNLSDNSSLCVEDIPQYIKDAVSEAEEESCTVTDKDAEALEREILINALKNNPNKAKAAKELGISRQLLNYRMIKYNVGKDDL